MIADAPSYSAAHSTCKKGKYGENQKHKEQDLGDSHERSGNASEAKNGRDESDEKASNSKL
jgi:hypothetical protein